MSKKKKGPKPASVAETGEGSQDAEVIEIAGRQIERGAQVDLALPITQSYSGADVTIPLRVIRGEKPGPVVLITAAIHGDELNGTGIIRELMIEPPFQLISGTLVLAPVINILGYERNTRYLPDRRDLNRHFPGASEGSMTSRIAHRLFHELLLKSDFLIDFHTAAVRRTNFPNVRADLSLPGAARIARAFGCPLVVDHKGAEGSWRLAAGEAGRAAMILEAGEVWKVERTVVEVGLRGVRNVLIELDMVEGEPVLPAYQARVDRSTWLRSDSGGLLRFHVAPGDVVSEGQPIAVCTSLLGEQLGLITAPTDGVVMGLTTLPSVKPGDPVCHLAIPRRGIGPILKSLRKDSDGSLHDRLRGDLASNVAVEQIDEDDW